MNHLQRKHNLFIQMPPSGLAWGAQNYLILHIFENLAPCQWAEPVRSPASVKSPAEPCSSRAVHWHTPISRIINWQGWDLHGSVWRWWSAKCYTAPRKELPVFLLSFLVIFVFSCADGRPRKQLKLEGVPGLSLEPKIPSSFKLNLFQSPWIKSSRLLPSFKAFWNIILKTFTSFTSGERVFWGDLDWALCPLLQLFSVCSSPESFAPTLQSLGDCFREPLGAQTPKEGPQTGGHSCVSSPRLNTSTFWCFISVFNREVEEEHQHCPSSADAVGINPSQTPWQKVALAPQALYSGNFAKSFLICPQRMEKINNFTVSCLRRRVMELSYFEKGWTNKAFQPARIINRLPPHIPALPWMYRLHLKLVKLRFFSGSPLLPSRVQCMKAMLSRHCL